MNEKIKVLIAEDDFIISEEIARIVKKLGYQKIGVATNGEKAVEMALKLMPDVILMDIKMPKMDGIEAAHRISEINSNISIVLLTAHESKDLIEKAKDSGISAYLTKPPKPEEIDRAISIAFARQKDLAESRRLVQELEKSKKLLNDANVAKDRFFSILAHDLRNPVSSLFSFTEYLNQHSTRITPENMLTYINAIHTTSKSLFDLLDELLLWGNLQSGRYHAEPKNIQLKIIAHSVINLLSANALRKEIQLTNEITDDCIAFADKSMIETAIRNLVSNALKFTPEKGSVIVSSKIIDNEIHVSIKDTGVGMRKEDMVRLFKIDDQFTMLGTNGEKGTGLGLVLCREMIEQNNGKIWVESEFGKGCNFTFALPVATNSQIN